MSVRHRPGDAARIRWRLPPYPAPDGPFLTRPGLHGPCTRANTLLLMAANIRKIRAWRALTAGDKTAIARRARRRRTSLPSYLPDG